MTLFETERLAVRPLTRQDIPALTEILSDPAVMEYSVRGVCNEAATRQFVEWCLGCYASHGMGPWALVEKATGDLVGFCGVGPEQVGDVEEANLGYRLAQRFWGRGLATEAVRGVLGYAFGPLELSSVVVIIEPEHGASLRVSEKAGFSDYTQIEFHDRPVRLYRMDRQTYLASNTAP